MDQAGNTAAQKYGSQVSAKINMLFIFFRTGAKQSQSNKQEEQRDNISDKPKNHGHEFGQQLAKITGHADQA